ncbi:MAG: alanine racemase [Deltaproteobacteria bacterium]|nr:alanine racemase [Deltaproteobacteria bacterium]
MAQRLTWCEISRDALLGNLAEFRRLVGPGCRLAPVVKANAYGHGMELAARVFVDGGADALCVNDVWEAQRLRGAGIETPLVILGNVTPEQAGDVAATGAEVTAYDRELLTALDRAGREAGRGIDVIIKIETGTNRQGVGIDDAAELVSTAAGLDWVRINGLSTHFADIEDTTDHRFARGQLARFNEIVASLKTRGLDPAVRSVGNSAATILWPEAHLDMVRVGIAAYGMWPSTETFVTAALTHRNQLAIRPAMTWKTVVAQVKNVPAGEYVGYGRTFRTTHPTRIAVLPVGYYDGYDRGVSNMAWVLVNGRRAQVRGRVCMNMVMVDVTDIPGVAPGDEVVLLGSDGEEEVTAEQFASWAGTINYEVTTRIAESVPRKEIPGKDSRKEIQR